MGGRHQSERRVERGGRKASEREKGGEGWEEGIRAKERWRGEGGRHQSEGTVERGGMEAPEEVSAILASMSASSRECGFACSLSESVTWHGTTVEVHT